jgi:hypothetical protein
MTRTQHHADHLDRRFREDWANHSLPITPEQWVQRAQEVAQILAVDAAAREKKGKTPYAEVALLKESGLVTLLARCSTAVRAKSGRPPTTSSVRSPRVTARSVSCSVTTTCGTGPLGWWAPRSRSRTSRRRRCSTGGSSVGRSIPVMPTWSSGTRASTWCSTAGRRSLPAARSPTSPSWKASWMAPTPMCSPSCPATNQPSPSTTTGTTSANG